MDVCFPLKNENVTGVSTVRKSLNDSRDYRVVKLDNGLTALVISDISSATVPDENCVSSEDDVMVENDNTDCVEDGEEGSDIDSDDSSTNSFDMRDESSNNARNRETKLAAGALCVGVGSFADPNELPGLAHFLEHMVFMGSEKYPDENAFDEFLKKHGGGTNAFTDCERTVYMFDVRPKYLKEALDRFAQFFISPLMKKDSVDREILAVDSEFKMCLQSDRSRQMQLLGNLTCEGHPFQKFFCGNEQTLKLTPDTLGIDIYEQLRLFQKQNYSSHYMTLAVISNESLDDLETWIREIFHSVPRNDSPMPTYESFENKFDPVKFRKLFKVVPVKDTHKIEITWALPPLFKYYRTKPLDYVSWLLGHEGHGSVLSLLKEKGWATALTCGNSASGEEFNSAYSLFTCKVNLTLEITGVTSKSKTKDSGLENYYKCVTIVFQYLEMLRQIGPQSRIFEEIKQIDDNCFRFKEQDDAIDYVEEIVQSMQAFPPCEYLTGKYLTSDFDEKIIARIQNELVPEKANIMVISKTFRHECNEKELWYGTQFCCQDIDATVVKSWKNLEPHPDLHLPSKNIFISTNFDISPCNANAEYPIIVHECPKGKVWHKQDTKFLIPKALYNIYLKSPLINQSPKMLVTAEMFTLLLELDLKNTAYAAIAADLSYQLIVNELAVELNFCGFSEKLSILFQTVFEHLVKFEATTSHFNMVKEQLTRLYYNRLIKPEKLVRSVRLKLLQLTKWTDFDKYEAIPTVTIDDLKNFTRIFKCSLYVESLFQGNITAQEAVAHQDFIYRHFIFDPLPEDLRPAIRVVRLPEGENICKVNGFNKNNPNTVITNYYQIGPASGKDLVFTHLLLDIMEEPCFDDLRTKQQLGYSVFCTCRETFGILGFSLTLETQAEKYSADYAEERMDVFLKNFLKGLATMDAKKFENHVSSMIKIKNHDDLKLKEEMDRNWKEITNETYMFDRLKKEISHLKLLTKESFLDWVTNTACKEFKKLSVQVLGYKTNTGKNIGSNSEEKLLFTPVSDNASGKHLIGDIDHFKKDLFVYPVSKFY